MKIILHPNCVRKDANTARKVRTPQYHRFVARATATILLLAACCHAAQFGSIPSDAAKVSPTEAQRFLDKICPGHNSAEGCTPCPTEMRAIPANLDPPHLHFRALPDAGRRRRLRQRNGVREPCQSDKRIISIHQRALVVAKSLVRRRPERGRLQRASCLRRPRSSGLRGSGPTLWRSGFVPLPAGCRAGSNQARGPHSRYLGRLGRRLQTTSRRHSTKRRHRIRVIPSSNFAPRGSDHRHRAPG
jgi:hypothetical protein